ncbi:MAG: hypothetical protein AAF282_11680 [Cyanobacteria bacterium P01_A01_bin.15]
MTVSNSNINWEALFYTLAAQTESLPDELLQVHQAVAQAPPEARSEAIDQLRQTIKQYPAFEAAYGEGLKQATRQYRSQHRAKSISLTLPVGTTYEQVLGEILCTPNPVEAAKRYLQTQQRRLNQKSTRKWNKVDQLVVMAAGGVALGTAAAQIPGAIIGGLVAVGCWYGISTKAQRLARLHPTKVTILRQLDQDMVSVDDLAYLLELSTERTQEFVRDLWNERYVRPISDNSLVQLWQSINGAPPLTVLPGAHEDLALTAKGYFYLHPGKLFKNRAA